MRPASFERHTRALKLSEAGQRLFHELRPLLSRIHHTIACVRDDDRTSSISIVCTHGVAHYWLLPRLSAFARRYPHISIDIRATNSINEKHCTDHTFGILYGDWKSLDAARLFPEIAYPVYSPAYYAGPVPRTLEALAKARSSISIPPNGIASTGATGSRHFRSISCRRRFLPSTRPV